MPRWDGLALINDMADYYAGNRSDCPEVPSYDRHIADLYHGQARAQAAAEKRIAIENEVRYAEYNRDWSHAWGDRARTANLTRGQMQRVTELLDELQSLIG